MTGVSSSCRDLVAKMLTVQPADRISLDSIRRHPWTEGCAPDDDAAASDTGSTDDAEAESRLEAADERMQRSLHLVLPQSLASASEEEAPKPPGKHTYLWPAGLSCSPSWCPLTAFSLTRAWASCLSKALSCPNIQSWALHLTKVVLDVEMARGGMAWRFLPASSNWTSSADLSNQFPMAHSNPSLAYELLRPRQCTPVAVSLHSSKSPFVMLHQK